MRSVNKRTLYSAIGVVIVLVIVVALNIISSGFFMRLDFTEGGIFTLSKGTKKLLAGLESPVTIRFYFSKSNSLMPMNLKVYAGRVDDLLREFKSAGGGKVVLEKYDPTPDSDAEDSAQMDGITPQMLNTGDRVYLGISVSTLDKSVALPMLSPVKEDALEYDIDRAIAQVSRKEKPVVGVMSSLPVLGEKMNQEMMMTGMMKRPESAWVTFKELQTDFAVRELPMDLDRIDDDINTLLVVHPTDISGKALFAIDQFLMRGGRLMVFLDPSSFYTMIKGRQNPQMMYAKRASDLGPLLAAWGVQYSKDAMVADMVYGKRIQTPSSMMTYPTILDINKSGLNSKEVASSSLEKVSMLFPGFFKAAPAEGLQKTVLVKSSKDSQVVGSFMADNPQEVIKNFKSGNEELDLVVLLKGKFKTAFPNGAPDDKVAADDKKAGGKSASADFLKESKDGSMVLLVGDSDMLFTEVCVSPYQTPLGQKVFVPQNDNLNFFLNAVELASGANLLGEVRCRNVVARPFKVINQIHAKAEKEYKDEISKCEGEMREVQEKLNALQRKKSKEQQLILSPEQQDQIKKCKVVLSETREKIKQLRKKLRKDIDSLENKIKWINIALVPALVVASGLVVAYCRKRRSVAK